MKADKPSRTAEATAFQRAAERRLPVSARVLDDPFAEHFLGPLRKAALSASGPVARLDETWLGLTPYVVCRHRYIDDRLAEALRDGVDQVVILGAGYDSRAYRFAAQLGTRPVFEVDHPATQGRKTRILASLAKKGALPAVDVRHVSIDFQRDRLGDRLESSGHRRDRRTFFVWEGVSMYLTRAAVKATLDAIRQLAPERSELVLDAWFLLDEPDLRATAHRLSANVLSVLGEPVTFSMHPEDVGAFLGRHGLSVVEVAGAGELELRYLRGGKRHVYPACYLVHARIDGEGRE